MTAARLLYAQNWKGKIEPTTEEWLLQALELVEMAKLTAIMGEKLTLRFIAKWNPFVDFMRGREKADLYICGFNP